MFTPLASGSAVAASLAPAFVGKGYGIGQSGVGEGEGRGARHCAGNVGHRIVDYAVDLIYRVGVCGGTGGLEAPPCSMATSTQHRARLHEPSMLREIRCGALAPGMSTEPITKSVVGSSCSMLWADEYSVLTLRGITSAKWRRVGSDMSAIVTSAPKPAAMRAGIAAYDSAAEHQHLCRFYARNSAEQYALPPCGFSRKRAPSCTDMRPATSLMGTSRAATGRAAALSRRLCTPPWRPSWHR